MGLDMAMVGAPLFSARERQVIGRYALVFSVELGEDGSAISRDAEENSNAVLDVRGLEFRSAMYDLETEENSWHRESAAAAS